MKKLVFMLGTVLTFGIASAQTEPATVKKDKTETTVVTQEKQRAKKEAGKVQPAATTSTTPQATSKKETMMQDQDVSKDHTKATPVRRTTADTTAVKKTASRKSKKS